MSEHYLYGTVPAPTNPQRVLEVKILNALNAGAVGNTTGAILQGAGVPGSAPANPNVPAIYTNLTTGDIYTWNVGTQAWF